MKKHEKKEVQEAELKAGIKDMSPLKKLEYFWMYDKWVIALVIGIIVLAIGGYRWYEHSKIQEILSIAAVNSMVEDTESLEAEILEMVGTGGKYEEVAVYSNFSGNNETGELEYYSQMTFVSHAAAGTLDVVLMPKSFAEKLDETGYFDSLEEVFGEDYDAVADYVSGNCLDLSETGLSEKFGMGDSIYVGVLGTSKHKENVTKYILSILGK
ncbi:MAG: hypothetical protein Q4B26_11655 [Eubacteriales bacterium]|nr:hypothetical protein [Eubacteriales bacterium]